MSKTTMGDIEVVESNKVRVKCRKCRTPIVLDFGSTENRDQAMELAGKIDIQPMECPGFHTELSGWRRLWRMDEAIDALWPAERGDEGSESSEYREHSFCDTIAEDEESEVVS